MAQLKLNHEETEILRMVLKEYTENLGVQIHRTEHHEFKEALEKREKVLQGLIGRLDSSH
jgi:metal-dependent HD superfamily phosphatase/phosphodiesterase